MRRLALGLRFTSLLLALALHTSIGWAELRAVLIPEAQPVTEQFKQKHYVGPDTAIPDGYVDGGRGMKILPDRSVRSSREILVINREQDPELTAALAFARSPELQTLSPIDRVQRLAEYIDQKTTPPGGTADVTPATEEMQKTYTNQPVLIGDWVAQSQAGVCRHRSLLFKVMGDAANLQVALVRGNYMKNGKGGAHAWNEVFLDDGRRLLVDVMHNGGKAKFPPVTDAKVVERYRKVDDSPWYGD